MQIQKISNNQPSFNAKLTVSANSKMIGSSEIGSLKDLAKKIGSPKDLIQISIGQICKPNHGDATTWYSIEVLSCIGQKLQCRNMGQAKVLAAGEELPKPFDVLSKFLNRLAETNPAKTKFGFLQQIMNKIKGV